MTTTKRERYDPHTTAPLWRRWWSQAKRRCLGGIRGAHRGDHDTTYEDDCLLVRWSSLPPEVVAAIVDHCPIHTVIRLQRTSRPLCAIASRALKRRLGQIMERCTAGNLLDWMASHFLEDNADGVAALFMSGSLTDAPMCFAGGEQCALDFHAIRAGDRPFDCEVHFGGAFLTVSAVALAVWVGAPRVLGLLASTRLGVGRSRAQLLDAVLRAAETAHCRGTRPYPTGAMIETVIGMTRPPGLLSGLWAPPFSHDRSPPLVALLCSAQQAVAEIARRSTIDHKRTRRHRFDTEGAVDSADTLSWQLNRLVERACDRRAYNDTDRARALDLVVAAADEVQLVRGVAGLVGAGMGADVRGDACGRTAREAFFALASEGPVDAVSSRDPGVDIARAVLAQWVMILCDTAPRRVWP
ncbi:hypothetical protein pneo_cds_9 [Pandoravirus neocaledonia]|uniref:Uncharacterized protein n=1 Tax=Pandoravirus neocaledonia TaxID=2107708 RepID=A0A2U7UB15_9VIRU|nr:hypothetical protein pneo_cds_9 [Pandoravirus neocaledonia]AVK75616.1 hypothetical protein pneo_cds_9 [Pandoravirus neocaledonia]